MWKGGFALADNWCISRRRDPLNKLQKIGVHMGSPFGHKLSSDQDIFSPERYRIDAELTRDAVDHAFDRPRGLDLTRRSCMSRRYFVGVGATSRHLQIGNSVATPTRNDRIVRRRCRAGCIGAGVHDQLDSKSRDGTVDLNADLCLEEHRVPGILQKTFLRGRNQLDRPAADLP